MEFLTSAAVIQLTTKQRPSAQRRALDKMKLPYIVRPDGSLAVPVGILQSKFGMAKPVSTEPKFEALYAQTPQKRK